VSADCAAASASPAEVRETPSDEASLLSVCASPVIWYSMDSAYISCSAVAVRPVASTVMTVSSSSAVHWLSQSVSSSSEDRRVPSSTVKLLSSISAPSPSTRPSSSICA